MRGYVGKLVVKWLAKQGGEGELSEEAEVVCAVLSDSSGEVVLLSCARAAESSDDEAFSPEEAEALACA
jgi:hypothetical protein